ncbi:hypothetical protein GCM10010412_095280 [Nonomuraea recticatena]|uniref:Uncharacterized protein n=1 Tax=Nonomuraea recticatena TaxID=46178 RepID=A0ABN3TBY1_9ACTN
MPLALEQAAAYCILASISWAEYLRRYQSDRTQILARGTPPDHPVPVIVTWQLTLKHLDESTLAAGQLLRLLAFVAPAPIPRDLPLHQVRSLPRGLRRAAVDPLAVDAAIAAVLAHSLLTPSDPGNEGIPGEGLMLHQLVQTVIQEHIRFTAMPSTPTTVVDQLAELLPRRATSWSTRRWVVSAIDLLLAATPPDPHGDHRAWPRYAMLLPHVLALLERAKQWELASPALAALQHAYGDYLEARRQDRLAIDLLEQALTGRIRLLGPRHPRHSGHHGDPRVCPVPRPKSARLRPRPDREGCCRLPQPLRRGPPRHSQSHECSRCSDV